MSPPVLSPAASAEARSRLLGESTAVVSSGPWFSAVTSATFAEIAVEVHERGAEALVLDLSGVRAVDTAGTATLEALAEELDSSGCVMAVAATHQGLVEWLIDSHLDVDLPVHETVEEALADLLRRPV
jgi:anti-anti-sigma regulatory factor